MDIFNLSKASPSATDKPEIGMSGKSTVSFATALPQPQFEHATSWSVRV
ncbi:hypothetical protein CSC22_5356 (plasmid) [Escherichia coli]|nr:hypothetical protein CSC22_5356 [Escherichia coli]